MYVLGKVPLSFLENIVHVVQRLSLGVLLSALGGLLFLQSEAIGQARPRLLDVSVSSLPPEAQVVGDASPDAKLTIEVSVEPQNREELNSPSAAREQLTTTE